jgi:hypothetical protein
VTDYVWQQAYDPFAAATEPQLIVNWKLVRHYPTPPRGQLGAYDLNTYATIYRRGERKWELWVMGRNDVMPSTTTYNTLKAAKAMGITLTRFNQAG